MIKYCTACIFWLPEVFNPLITKFFVRKPQNATFAEGLMTIANSLLLGQSATGLNFYDVSGRSALAD